MQGGYDFALKRLAPFLFRPLYYYRLFCEKYECGE